MERFKSSSNSELGLSVHDISNNVSYIQSFHCGPYDFKSFHSGPYDFKSFLCGPYDFKSFHCGPYDFKSFHSGPYNFKSFQDYSIKGWLLYLPLEVL